MELNVVGVEVEATATRIEWTLSSRRARKAGVERSHDYEVLDDGSARLEVGIPAAWDYSGWIRVIPPAPEGADPPTYHGLGTIYFRPGQLSKKDRGALQEWAEEAADAGVQVEVISSTSKGLSKAEDTSFGEWGETATLWGRRLRKLTSWRVLGTAILVGILGGLALSYIWEPLGTWAFWPLFAIALLLAMFNDDAVLYCPHCGKRVKVGHDTCHHCGKDVK